MGHPVHDAPGESLAELLEDAPVLLVWLDCNGRVERSNRRCADLAGWSLSDLVGRDWFATSVITIDRDRARANFLEAVRACDAEPSADPPPLASEPRLPAVLVTRDGHELAIAWRSRLRRDAEGRLVGVLAIGMESPDASAPPEREVAADPREHAPTERGLLRSIIDAFPGFVGLYDAEGGFLDANRAGAGAAARDARTVGTKLWDLPPWTTSPALRARARALMEQAMRGERVRFDVTVPVAGGGTVDVDGTFCPIFDERGAVTHVATIAFDVGDRNRATAKLKESEARLNEAQAVAKLGSWELDLVTGELSWSDEVFRIFELDRATFAPSYEAFLGTIHPDDRELVDGAYRRSLETRESYEILHRLRMPDGRIKHVRERGVSYWDDAGRAIRSVGTVQDVSAQVHAEQRLRRILDGLFAFVGVFDLEGRVLEANQAPLQLAGLRREDVLGERFWDTYWWSYSPDTQARIRDLLGRAARGETVRVDECARFAEGRLLDVDVVFAPLRDDTGAVEALIACGVDVTERKRTEDALERVQGLLLRAERLARLGSWSWDLTTDELQWSPQMYRIYGVDPLRHPSPTPELGLSRVHPDDRDRSLHATPSEYRIMREDGELRTLRSEAVTSGSGSGGMMYGFVQDVTELRAAERELRRTRDLLRRVLDASPDWIFAKDLSFRFLLVNEAYASSFGLAPEEMLGRPDTDFLPREQCEGDPSTGARGFHDYDMSAFVGVPSTATYEVDRLPGGRRIFIAFKGPLRDERGRAYGALTHARDVTQERAATEALARSLAEKETLLREIHHRVKNNLQIVSSLLYFQAKRARAPEDVAAFEEARTRLLSMTLVHEKLYQAPSLARIEMGDYLGSLVGALVETPASSGRIAVEVRAEGVELTLEVALPLGMIACELVTNVLKYAYPPGTAGTASVDMRSEGGRISLVVRDRGAGFPEGFDPEGVSSFGWVLVRNLSDQLGAAVVAENDQGAVVRVSFEAPS